MPDIIPFQPLRRSSRVLVAAPNGRLRDKLVADATLAGYEVQICSDLAAAAEFLSQHDCDACLVDLDEAGGGADSFCESAAQWRQPVTLLGLASPELLASPDVDADGRFELISKPCLPRRLAGRLAEVARRLELRKENARLERQSRRRLQDDVVGCSEAAETLRNDILAAAEMQTPLTVVGQRGAGTSLAARAVHLFSPRADGPLLAVDCSLLSSAALEEELFGAACVAGGPPAKASACGAGVPPANSLPVPAVRPAGQAAQAQSTQSDAAAADSRLKQASGGTLVLENIEAVPLALQKRLAEMLGSRRIAARVIAIMHADSAQQVKQGRLDAGLCELLCGQVIAVPPLCERRDDVVLLAEKFLQRLAVEDGRPPRRLAYDARQLLAAYNWPGNVSQLWNVIGRAVGLDHSGTLTADSLRPWLADESAALAGASRGMTLREMERKLIETTFARYCGNREQTAQALKIGLRTLSGKLREYGYPPRGGPGSNQLPAQRKAA